MAALRAHIDPDEDRIGLEGPPVRLAADLALPLSLVIHELATNATKYGSLGSEDGRVQVRWRHDDNSLYLNWTETGGPPVSVPTRRGFGSVLIERAFPSNARAQSRSEYKSDGLVFDLSFVTRCDE